MRIWHEKAGAMSEKAIWMCYSSGYLYGADALFKLFWCLITEWKNEKYLIG